MKWECKIIEISKRSFLAGKIDKQELEGWEVVSTSNNVNGGWGGFHAVLRRGATSCLQPALNRVPHHPPF